MRCKACNKILIYQDTAKDPLQELCSYCFAIAFGENHSYEPNTLNNDEEDIL